MVRHRVSFFKKLLLLLSLSENCSHGCRTFFYRALCVRAKLHHRDMEELTAAEIVALPLSSKEEQHRSRSRRAFNVFVSRFVTEFQSLHPHQQHERVFNTLEIRADNPNPYYSDEDSTDSHVERHVCVGVSDTYLTSSDLLLSRIMKTCK